MVLLLEVLLIYLVLNTCDYTCQKRCLEGIACQNTSHYLKHLSEMVVGQTRQPLDDIFAAAPVPMSIKITMTSEPKETVRYWGFEGGGVKTRELGVATGGLWVSGLIGTEFKLVARSDGHVTASRYESQGQYSGNWPISAAGAVYLLDVPDMHETPSI